MQIFGVFARQAENMFKLCVLVCLFPLSVAVLVYVMKQVVFSLLAKLEQ